MARWYDLYAAALDPCTEGLIYWQGYQTAVELWQGCNRGDWMLWLIGKLPSRIPGMTPRQVAQTCVSVAEECIATIPFHPSHIDAVARDLQLAKQWTGDPQEAKAARGATRVIYAIAIGSMDIPGATFIAYRATLATVANIVRSKFPAIPGTPI